MEFSLKARFAKAYLHIMLKASFVIFRAKGSDEGLELVLLG